MTVNGYAGTRVQAGNGITKTQVMLMVPGDLFTY